MEKRRFYDVPMHQNDLAAVVDKANIKELCEYDRYCRDNRLWDQLREGY